MFKVAIEFVKFDQEAMDEIGFACEAALRLANGEWIPVKQDTAKKAANFAQHMRLTAACDDRRFTPIAGFGYRNGGAVGTIALMAKGLYFEIDFSSWQEDLSFGLDPALAETKETLEAWRHRFVEARRPPRPISYEEAWEALNTLLRAACGCSSCPVKDDCDSSHCRRDVDGYSQAYQLLDEFIEQCKEGGDKEAH